MPVLSLQPVHSEPDCLGADITPAELVEVLTHLRYRGDRKDRHSLIGIDHEVAIYFISLLDLELLRMQLYRWLLALNRQRSARCGPLFLTWPTILPTGQIFSDASGLGLSGATSSSSAAGVSPSHFGQSASSTITGIRSCNSPIASLGPQVRIVVREILRRRSLAALLQLCRVGGIDVLVPAESWPNFGSSTK